MNEVHVSRLAWSTSRPPTTPPRSPSSSCLPTGGRRRTAEHTTRDAGELGLRLRCYLDLRQLHFLTSSAWNRRISLARDLNKVPVARHGPSCEG
ncbi:MULTISPECIES: DUF6207 family protein [Streptomyces]|uniref:DUF6207 family protein n=1 Tax=Streptomyces TaxID=1883 RepID=UPI002D7A1DE9|nr:DUF6207 family protein [Streptomyces marianii]